MMNLDWIPKSDQLRSPYSKWVFDQAKKRSLFFSHFESRYSLPVPEVWGGSSEEAIKSFDGYSVLEDKFSDFRTDCLVASFHPGHHPKWSAHELLHNLLGFFYHKQATDLEVLLGARISEGLPVALYYFLDESWAVKCEKHQGSTSFLSEHCQDCLSLQGNEAESADSYLLNSAREFFEREKRSIENSLKNKTSGELIFHGINLASDAHLYLQSHRDRLRDPFIDNVFKKFFSKNPVYHNISEFLGQSEVLFNALTENEDLPPVDMDSLEYLKQDLAMRLLQMARLCGEGELSDKLFAGFSILENQDSKSMIDSFVSFYEKLYEEYELIAPKKFFALGYDFHPTYGHDIDAIESNLSVCFQESLAKLAKQERENLVFAFTRSKNFWQRSSLAKRFCQFLESIEHQELSSFQKEGFFCTEKSNFHQIQYTENKFQTAASFHPYLECIDLSEKDLSDLNLETGGISGEVVYLKIPGRSSYHFFPLAKSEFLALKKYLKTGQVEGLAPSVIDELERSNFIIGVRSAGNLS